MSAPFGLRLSIFFSPSFLLFPMGDSRGEKCLGGTAKGLNGSRSDSGQRRVRHYWPLAMRLLAGGIPQMKDALHSHQRGHSPLPSVRCSITEEAWTRILRSWGRPRQRGALDKACLQQRDETRLRSYRLLICCSRHLTRPLLLRGGGRAELQNGKLTGSGPRLWSELASAEEKKN